MCMTNANACAMSSALVNCWPQPGRSQLHGSFRGKLPCSAMVELYALASIDNRSCKHYKYAVLRESINSCAGCQQILQSLCTNIQLCIVACTAHTGLKLGIVAACCFQTLRSLTQLSETQCREASHGRLLKSSQGGSLCYCPPCPFCLSSSPCSLSSLPCCLSLAACACLAYSFDHVLTACITCCWLSCSPSCYSCPPPA